MFFWQKNSTACGKNGKNVFLRSPLFVRQRQHQKLCECNYNGALGQDFCSLQSHLRKICTWWHQHAGRDHELLRCCKPMNGGADPNSIKEVGARSKWNNYHQTEGWCSQNIPAKHCDLPKINFSRYPVEQPAVEKYKVENLQTGFLTSNQLESHENFYRLAKKTFGSYEWSGLISRIISIPPAPNHGGPKGIPMY